MTEPAEKSLQQIFQFYSQTVSKGVAIRITERILDRVEKLTSLPERGKIEFFLSELKQGHRYIIEGKYKIIYLMGVDKVIVTDIFDTRQNPDEILKRAK